MIGALTSVVMPDIANKPSVEPQTPVVVEPHEISALPYEYIIAAMAVIIVILIGLLIRERRSTAKRIPLENTSENRNRSPKKNTPLKFRVGNFHNIGRREEQQDSFCSSDINDRIALLERGLLAVVADGMGGMEGGAAISRLVTDTFLKHYTGMGGSEPKEFLYGTARAAEVAVEDYIRRTGIKGGSTVVAILIKDNELHFVSVGDSRIYMLRRDDLVQLNHEHTFGAFLREQAAKGEVDPDEPFTNPKRDALTAYIGMGSFKTVDSSSESIPLMVGDKILLCSDGVFNTLDQAALTAALESDALSAAERIEQEILARAIDFQDNFTGVIVECIGID